MANNAPAGTRDYVYPALIEELEQDAIDKAEREANQGGITDPIVRDTLPETDFNIGADVTNVTGVEWGVTVDGDQSAGDEVEIFEIDSDTGNHDERVTAIYGYEAVTNADLIDEVIYRGSDGQVFENAVVAGLDSAGNNPVDAQKAQRSPISFGPQENGTISIVPNTELLDADDDTIELKLLAVTAEKIGRVIGTRSTRD